jgi:hypothetical protein
MEYWSGKGIATYISVRAWQNLQQRMEEKQILEQAYKFKESVNIRLAKAKCVQWNLTTQTAWDKRS